jgi:hypothetical protein
LKSRRCEAFFERSDQGPIESVHEAIHRGTETAVSGILQFDGENMESTAEYWLTRLIFQRAFAFIYLIGFAIAINQGRALIGHSGLQPMHLFLQRVKFWDAPSVLWLQPSDSAFLLVAVATYLPALSLGDSNFQSILSEMGWNDEGL